MALKRIGVTGRLVSHGIRSMTSTTLKEQGFDLELIEEVVAYVHKNEVGTAIISAYYIERRRPMTEWWSRHIEKATTGNLFAAAVNQVASDKIVSIR